MNDNEAYIYLKEYFDELFEKKILLLLITIFIPTTMMMTSGTMEKII